MLKKIILSIAVTAVLIGAASLIGQERRDRPQARPRQRQVLEGRQRTGREALREHAEQSQQQRATREARRKRMENSHGKPQPVRPEQNQPGFPQGGVPAQPGQMFGGCLDELTEAYRGNDREKMGQLLRKMHQLRRDWQEVRSRGFQGRGIRRWGHGWQGRGIGRRGQSFQGRGMTGRWGRGFQGRGMGRPGPGMPPPPLMEKLEPPEQDVDRPSPPMPHRGMTGRWGRGFQGRGMGRPGPGMPPPPLMEKPEPPEDVDRPSPPMPRRGMGRRGRGSPEQ